MIISASRRTDIPAFYSDWFMERIREGFFHRVNPFNSRQVSGFSLKAEDVDAICFWSKYPRPLLRHLDELDRRGLNYYFQFTLNPYDATFEPHLPTLDERIATMIELAGRIGPDRVVWRYDPVILSSATPLNWHLEWCGHLAERLRGATRRLMFSYHDRYGRGEGRLQRGLNGSGITVADLAAPEQREARERFERGLAVIAATHAMEIYSCCEQPLHGDGGIINGACIDGPLIRRLFGITAPLPQDSNQRDRCNCVASVDMGAYNSCPFRCRYCYANFSDGMIEANGRKQLPHSAALVGEYTGVVEIRTRDYQSGTRRGTKR